MKPRLEELPRLETPMTGKKNLSALKLPYSSSGSTKIGSFTSQPGEITLSNSSLLAFETENNIKTEVESSKPCMIITKAKQHSSINQT
jgi:hypothetical protein